MLLTRITARNFRNLADAPIEFHPATNLIVGRNGQGKTNLLEAIYFLATTKSFRTPRLASVIRFGETSVYVAGALRRFDVEKTISRSASSAKRAGAFCSSTKSASRFRSMSPR